MTEQTIGLISAEQANDILQSLRLEYSPRHSAGATLDNLLGAPDPGLFDEPARDAVNPAHYKDGWSNGAEVIDLTERLDFSSGNAVKYICRAGKKPGESALKDLLKAQWYLERRIALLEESGQTV